MGRTGLVKLHIPTTVLETTGGGRIVDVANEQSGTQLGSLRYGAAPNLAAPCSTTLCS